MKTQEIFDGGEDTKDELYDQNTNKSRRNYLWAGALVCLSVSGIAAAGTYAWASKEAKIEAENSLNEGLLRAGGFDENGIDIDISGDTDVITIGCPGTVLESTENNQTRLSYVYDAETVAASWEVANQLDQSGQVVATFEPIVYPLGTKILVAEFIDEDLVQACNAIASN
jgi:hypothetical protein